MRNILRWRNSSKQTSSLTTIVYQAFFFYLASSTSTKLLLERQTLKLYIISIILWDKKLSVTKFMIFYYFLFYWKYTEIKTIIYGPLIPIACIYQFNLHSIQTNKEFPQACFGHKYVFALHNSLSGAQESKLCKDEAGSGEKFSSSGEKFSRLIRVRGHGEREHCRWCMCTYIYIYIYTYIICRSYIYTPPLHLYTSSMFRVT